MIYYLQHTYILIDVYQKGRNIYFYLFYFTFIYGKILLVSLFMQFPPTGRMSLPCFCIDHHCNTVGSHPTHPSPSSTYNTVHQGESLCVKIRCSVMRPHLPIRLPKANEYLQIFTKIESGNCYKNNNRLRTNILNLSS